MAVLYSDGSRKLLLQKSKTWNKKIEVLNTIEYILRHKYLRTDKIHDDYAYFDKIRPEYILSELYKHNSNKFGFNPDKDGPAGYSTAIYIRKIYKFLGAKVLFVDYNETEKALYYSLYNNTKRVNTDLGGPNVLLELIHKSIQTVASKCENPDIIIVHIFDKNMNMDESNYPLWYKLEGDNFKGILDNLNSGQDNVVYEDNVYTNDSMLIRNHNVEKRGHSIAGITCKNERYVYNGWTRTTIDPNITNKWEKHEYKGETLYYNRSINKVVLKEDLPKDAIIASANVPAIPCELMKFDWNPNKDVDFCLNPSKCVLDIMDLDKNKLCFSFNKHDRQLIFIKKTKASDIEDKIDVKEKKCPPGKVINPLTGRCVTIKSINQVSDSVLSRPDKKCPEGKMINPKTGRCIKIKRLEKLLKKVSSKQNSPQRLSPNIVSSLRVSPLRVSSLRVSPKKVSHKRVSPKNCPEGKEINPKTGRCIKIKPFKPVKPVKPVKSVKQVKPVKPAKPVKPVKPAKVCPEGKVINPKTGRCIKVKS
jgi:hypothetical protein